MMVKELEDSPRDDVAVVLDAWRGCPEPVFDVAVRAAGSILATYARRSRRVSFVLAAATVEVQRIQAEGDWRRALELLVAPSPMGRRHSRGCSPASEPGGPGDRSRGRDAALDRRSSTA